MKIHVAVVAIVVPMVVGAFQPGSQTERLTWQRRAWTRAPRFEGRSVWDSVYTDEQGKRGLAVYAAKCSRCHQDSLIGDDDSAPLAGDEFLGHWDGMPVKALHDLIRQTMPDDDPGTVSRPEISDVLAYILKFNRFPAGRTELPVDSDSLKAIQFDAKKKVAGDR